VREQPALAVESPGVAGETAIGAHHAVAWHDDADGIGAVGVRDRPDCVRTSDAPRELAVRQRRPGSDPSQLPPDPALELRSSGLDRDGVQRTEVAGQVRTQRVHDTSGAVAGHQLHGVFTVVQTQEAGHPGLGVLPVEGAQMSALILDDQRDTDRCRDTIQPEAAMRM
jgi:hypothetical protein